MNTTKLRSTTASSSASMATMKKLMRTTISAICYQRDIFPEDCFEDEAIDSMKLKMLPKLKSKSKTKDKRSCRTRGLSQQQQGASDDDRNNCRLFQEWIEDGVMEALEKQYLRTLVFAVFDGSDGTDAATAKLHECYVYKVKYTDESVGIMDETVRGIQYDMKLINDDATNKHSGTSAELTEVHACLDATITGLINDTQRIADAEARHQPSPSVCGKQRGVSEAGRPGRRPHKG